MFRKKTLSLLDNDALYSPLFQHFKPIHYIISVIYYLLGFLFCLLSLFCGLMMAFFDKRAARLLKKDDAKTGKISNIIVLNTSKENKTISDI